MTLTLTPAQRDAIARRLAAFNNAEATAHKGENLDVSR